MKKIGFIGAGNMGGALIKGLISFGAVEGKNVYVCGHHPEKLRAMSKELGFHISETRKDLYKVCDTVLFAVKPYHIEEILEEDRDLIKRKTVLSVISGYDFDRWQPLIDPSTRFQYIMPNTPAGSGAGVFMFEDKHSLYEEESLEVEQMFSHIGRVFKLPSRLMSAGAAVAGCGPAFIAMVIEALSDAGVKYGIPRALSYELVSQMVLGTAKMQIETGLHPGLLKDGVCSPGGTTIRGVQALEKAGMRAAFTDAVDAVMSFGK